MRLRTQIGLLIGASLLLGLAVAAAAIHAVGIAQRASAAGEQSHTVLREARAMLVLTHEAARYGHERIARQWHARYRALEAGVAAARAAAPDEVEPPEVDGVMQTLPTMFEMLTSTFAATPDDALRQQRRELLVDLLVAETQAVTDEIYRWSERVDRRRQATERRIAVLAALGPALMALPLIGMGWLMAVRVLQPVGRLQQTMARVETGDLGARLSTSRHDEIGDLKRAFTRMTESLQASTTRLADNEQRLRLITDHLPARVSHYRMDDRCTFANRPFCEAWGYTDEAQVLGRTSAELLPAPLYAALQPWIAAAKAGAAQFFLVSLPGRRHHEFAMVPDRAADGTVQGLYVMAREVTERVEAEARIEAALHEKEVLLKEVHHRVKNNMQIVSSLLQLQSGATESAAVRTQLAESQDRIRSMALIHEKLYEHHDFARIDFADYLHGLLAVLAAAHGRGQRLEVHAESLWLGIDQAVPTGLILNELMTNSWKHGFPAGRSGCIEVRFEALEGKRVRLSVADDGVGVAPGFEPAAHPSLGLRLVHLLAEQLDAELHFGPGPGFSCSLSFERQSLLPSGASHG